MIGLPKNSRWIFIALLTLLVPVATQAREKKCYTAEEAAKMLDKDVCLSAHIYDVVELPDGTRYLDICMPDTPDEKCFFTIVSFWEDHVEVGELIKYRGQDVRVRGIVRPMHGRAGMTLSHARQFYLGPEKFRPNPKLIRGFDGAEDRHPLHDPNLQSQGHVRGFMNSRTQETRPIK